MQERILHECICTLLRLTQGIDPSNSRPVCSAGWETKYPDDEDVECCCKLLASTEPNIDTTLGNDNNYTRSLRGRAPEVSLFSRVGQYFYFLSAISRDKRTNSRIRFMVMVSSFLSLRSCFVLLRFILAAAYVCLRAFVSPSLDPFRRSGLN